MPEIATSCRRVIVVVRHSPRTFVDRVDFITSMGFGSGAGNREKLGCRGAGPVMVISDLGVFTPDDRTCELTLRRTHPGVTIDQVREATGWRLAVGDEVAVTEPATPEELEVLRALHGQPPPRSEGSVP